MGQTPTPVISATFYYVENTSQLDCTVETVGFQENRRSREAEGHRVVASISLASGDHEDAPWSSFFEGLGLLIPERRDADFWKSLEELLLFTFTLGRDAD